MNELKGLIEKQLAYYVERQEYYTDKEPDYDLREFYHQQALDLVTVENGEQVLTLTYHRHLSDSYGLVFDIEHGDPELFFHDNIE